jgi:HAD superfamily hydrolase (TIGR01509 family)
MIGVIFDMDGVLIDSAGPHFRSWQLLAEECSGKVTEEQFSETFGRQNRDIIPVLFGPVPDARMRALGDRKEEIYRDLIRECPPIVDGAVGLVRGLHGAGARLAIGSSGPAANIELVVAAMGVADCISVIVSGDDVTRGKPDPQVFTAAAERLGLEPSRCVVVEDAPVGIRAARAAGARTVAVMLHHPAEAFEDTDLVVPRLSDLTAERIIHIIHRQPPAS